MGHFLPVGCSGITPRHIFHETHLYFFHWMFKKWVPEVIALFMCGKEFKMLNFLTDPLAQPFFPYSIYASGYGEFGERSQCEIWYPKPRGQFLKWSSLHRHEKPTPPRDQFLNGGKQAQTEISSWLILLIPLAPAVILVLVCRLDFEPVKCKDRNESRGFEHKSGIIPNSDTVFEDYGQFFSSRSSSEFPPPRWRNEQQKKEVETSKAAYWYLWFPHSLILFVIGTTAHPNEKFTKKNQKIKKTKIEYEKYAFWFISSRHFFDPLCTQAHGNIDCVFGGQPRSLNCRFASILMIYIALEPQDGNDSFLFLLARVTAVEGPCFLLLLRVGQLERTGRPSGSFVCVQC